jgi:hypothetical protein
MKPPKIDVEVIAHPETTPIIGNASATGDPKVDKRQEDHVVYELATGNQWAWCIVEVKVSIGPCPRCKQERQHSVTLGGVSARGEEDFMTSGYYDDMVAECLEALGYDKEPPGYDMRYFNANPEERPGGAKERS